MRYTTLVYIQIIIKPPNTPTFYWNSRRMVTYSYNDLTLFVYLFIYIECMKGTSYLHFLVV